MTRFYDIDTCLAYLFSLKRKNTDAEDSLTYMQKLCNAYHNPEKGLKFIHVAGTNGKGSIVAYLKEILQAGHVTVGTFVSPNVSSFNERITYQNNLIADDELLKLTNKVVGGFDGLSAAGVSLPGFFSLITLIAFMYFQIKKPDVVIMEAGIGGRYDSTNVISPLLSVISNVTFDHMRLLGNSLPEIAENKLGIAKKNVPLITVSNPLLNDMYRAYTAKSNSPLILVEKKDIVIVDAEIDATRFSYQDYHNLVLKMPGLYQPENAAIAIEACRISNKYFKIGEKEIKEGLAKAFMPGRLEIVHRHPLIIIDGAHNIDAMLRLREYVTSFPDKKFTLVLAISSDKEISAMIKIIEPVASNVVFTSYSYPRSAKKEDLYKLSHHPHKETEDILAITRKAYFSRNCDRIWLFAGSLYFAGEVRNIIRTLSSASSPIC